MEEQQQLTKKQVWDVLQFADGLNNSYRNSIGLYTPDLLSKNLERLTSNPIGADYDSIVKALKDTPNSSELLSSFSQYMNYFDRIFSQTIDYFANMLSFDLRWDCINAFGTDYSSKEYKEDENRVFKFLDNFDYKTYFKDVVKNILINDVDYRWFRDNGIGLSNKKVPKYALQIMPKNYCMITGYCEYGFLYDFNMSLFLNPSIDINLFAPVFKKYYLNVFQSENQYNYIPSNQFVNRDGTWAYWTQTSPNDGAWVFKYNTNDFAITPPLANLMKDTVLDSVVQKLQNDKNFASAYGLLIGEIKMLKDTNEPNATAFEPSVLGQLLSLVREGIGSNIKIGAMPAENVDFYQFEDKDTEMYTTQTKNSASLGASASRVIYSTDKVSEAELFAQISNDYGKMKKLYTQFENFLNYFVNKKLKKYHFRFHFDGSNYWFEQKNRQDKVIALADRGIILSESAFAQAFGYEPQSFSRMLDEGKNSNFMSKLGQLMSIHTANVTENQGRPEQDEVKTESRDYD